MSLKFPYCLIFINVCQVQSESSLYSRINYVHILTGNFSASVRIIKTMHTGFSAYVAFMPTPGVTRKKPDIYDLAWKRFV